MHAYRNLVASTNQWNNTVPGGGISGDAYKNSYTYDANGNIKTLNRAGVNGAYFDQLNYKYDERPTTGGATKLESNKLYTVIDPATPLTTAATQPIEDIKTMTAFVPYDAANPATFKNNNFYYDEIGNLIQDKSSHITNIEWNAYGKIRKITMENQYSDLAFEYDASGNRTAKIEQKKDQSTFIVLAPTEWKYTYYVHDAKGNIMSVYEKNPTLVVGGAANDLIQTQVPIYGSSRIGLYDPEVDLTTTTTVSSTFARRFLKQKQYELTNHLGNVLTTISDRKLKNSSGTIAYSAEIISAQDYYPFGMQMPGRSFNSTEYRYGFNGKEKDDEIKGSGNSLDFGARIYDPRIGRFLSVDPQFMKGPEYSTYNFAFNNPLSFVDEDGKWPTKVHEQILRKAFEPELKSGHMTEKQIKAIIRGSEKADNPLLGNQSDARQYMHAEKPKNKSVAEAIKMKNEFIKDKEGEFINSKDEIKGLISLGMALHPIMDENSPAHGTRNADGSFTPTEYVKPLKHAHDENPKNIDPVKMNGFIDEAAGKVRTEYLKVKEQKDAKTNSTSEKKVIR